VHAHPLAVTTHTLELDQVAEINEHLARSSRRLTAADLLVDGMRLLTGAGRGVPQPAGRPVIPAFAVLRRVEASGPPEYPYVRGHFGGEPWRSGDLVVELHTAALVALSHRLDLRHRWGAR
jgi:hypothetical protein